MTCVEDCSAHGDLEEDPDRLFTYDGLKAAVERKNWAEYGELDQDVYLLTKDQAKRPLCRKKAQFTLLGCKEENKFFSKKEFKCVDAKPSEKDRCETFKDGQCVECKSGRMMIMTDMGNMCFTNGEIQKVDNLSMDGCKNDNTQRYSIPRYNAADDELHCSKEISCEPGTKPESGEDNTIYEKYWDSEEEKFEFQCITDEDCSDDKGEVYVRHIEGWEGLKYIFVNSETIGKMNEKGAMCSTGNTYNFYQEKCTSGKSDCECKLNEYRNKNGDCEALIDCPADKFLWDGECVESCPMFVAHSVNFDRDQFTNYLKRKMDSSNTTTNDPESIMAQMFGKGVRLNLEDTPDFCGKPSSQTSQSAMKDSTTKKETRPKMENVCQMVKHAKMAS